MNEKEPISFTKKFKGLFNEGSRNSLGQRVGLSRRLRVVTPYRLAVVLVSLFATRPVATIADIVRGFSALCGEGVEYKPFHNQLRKPGFADFMREFVSELLGVAIVRVLRPKRGGVLSRFKRVVIQDGSLFAVKDDLRKVFPGRFRATNPAAVELPATYNLFQESMEQITLRADTDSGQLELPAAAGLKGALFLADRGYMNLLYFREVVEAGGSFIVRGKSSLNPKVLSAHTAGGRRLNKFTGKSLKEIRGLAKNAPTNLEVEWQNVQGQSLALRSVAAWSPKEKRHLVTNLACDSHSASEVLELYGLRGQVELVFKEWESYANLHALTPLNRQLRKG